MEEVKTNAGQGLGTAGLILGIIAVPLAILGCTSVLGLILGVTGTVLSAVGLSQATKSNGVKGLPTAGLVVSILGTCIALLMMLFLTTAIKEGGKWWAKEGIPLMEEIKKDFGDEMEQAMEDFGDEMEELSSELEDKLENLEYDLEWEESWGEEITEEEFEDVLDAYKSLISDYLDLVKLADEGDMNAIVEYVKVSAKAAALAARIENISPQLTEDQLEKFKALQKKYEAALEEATEK